MLKIYGAPPSPPVNRVRMTANCLELEYEFVLVNMMQGEHRSEAFRRLHPAGKVPAIDDGGFVLFESLAICRYLARKAASPLYPADIPGGAIVDAWMDFAASHIGGAMGKVLFNHLFAPLMGAEIDTRSMAEGRQWLDRFLPVLETRLTEHAYLAGPALSIADIVLLANLDPVEVIEVDLSPYTKLVAWREQLRARPFYTACHNSYGEVVAAMRAQRGG